jgi:hypothetical protein
MAILNKKKIHFSNSPWFLASRQDTVIKGSGDGMGLEKCKFGNLELTIGDQLSSDDMNIECKCEVPPMPYCVRKSFED